MPKTLIVEVLSPEENMKRDEEALFALEVGRGFPNYRIFKWDRMCLSIGKNQKPPQKPQLPWVKRPTGGGILLHGWDISFSFTDLKSRWGNKPTDIYIRVAQFLADTFKEAGVSVQIQKFPGNYRENPYCFYIPSFGEISLEGKKLLSLAMRTLRKSFLLQGSVYEFFDFKRASDLLGVPEKELRSRIITLEELPLKGEFILLLKKRLQELFKSS